jgi:DNA-binding transcriptional MerR regulator
MASGPFTLAQLADVAGMSIDDVRFTLDRGLLQKPRRHVSRPNNFFFHAEHVDRLTLIKHALACGYTHEDIAAFVDPVGLVTCRDVYDVTHRRIEALRADGKSQTREAACLTQLRETCPGVGTRKDCRILETLSGPDG